MTESRPKPRRSPRDVMTMLGNFATGIGRRIYALGLMALVLWLSFLAFRYLVDALMFEPPPPPQLVDLPRRLDEEFMRRDREAFAGVHATEHPRTPPAHYHRIDAGFQPDRFNNCTQGGCHEPLPHGNNKADRAFLNMHATSIQCGVCHLDTDAKPLPITWYDLRDGRPRGAPALLQAYSWLEKHGVESNEAHEHTAEQQREIVQFLRQAAVESGDVPDLSRLAEHLHAVRYQSDEFTKLLQLAWEIVPKHFRGEYGSKLALKGPDGEPWLGHPGNGAAVAEFLANRDKLSDADRETVLARVHPKRRSPTLQCTNCHSVEGGLVDFAGVGYPEGRVRKLTHPLIMQTIEHMMNGEVLHLPSLLSPGRKSDEP